MEQTEGGLSALDGGRRPVLVSELCVLDGQLGTGTAPELLLSGLAAVVVDRGGKSQWLTLAEFQGLGKSA